MSWQICPILTNFSEPWLQGSKLLRRKSASALRGSLEVVTRHQHLEPNFDAVSSTAKLSTPSSTALIPPGEMERWMVEDRHLTPTQRPGNTQNCTVLSEAKWFAGFCSRRHFWTGGFQDRIDPAGHNSSLLGASVAAQAGEHRRHLDATLLPWTRPGSRCTCCRL